MRRVQPGNGVDPAIGAGAGGASGGSSTKMPASRMETCEVSLLIRSSRSMSMRIAAAAGCGGIGTPGAGCAAATTTGSSTTMPPRWRVR